MGPTLPIFDGHNDVLLALHRPTNGKRRSFFERNEQGHLDVPRARAGGFAGGFFAVFVSNDPKGPTEPEPIRTDEGYEFPYAPALDTTYALRTAIAMTARLLRLEAASDGQLRVVRTVDEIETCLRDGTIAAVLHIEGAAPIDTDLDALYVFYEAGLRSVGITWSRPNAFGYGVPFKYPASPDTGPGLTEAGRRLVHACNELGIMLDLSHLNERGFWDVARLSTAPLVATHSNVHTLCPTTRNLTDAQLDAIGASGGVVGINFAVAFLREDGEKEEDTPLTTIVRHIDYVADRLGIDHVALGSDFDGATIPRQLGDVAGLPSLIAALQAHGYDEPALRKLTHENWCRVLRRTWQQAVTTR